MHVKGLENMEKVAGKEIPIEKQRDLLVAQNALKLPLLYQNLVDTYGKEKGEAVYRELENMPEE